MWQGPQRAVHSLALCNRELCRTLLQRGHELSLRPTGPEDASERLAGMGELAALVNRPLPRAANAHVALQWPPNWGGTTGRAVGRLSTLGIRSRAGKLWVATLNDRVKTNYGFRAGGSRIASIRSGVAAGRVHVVPLGVDTEKFRPRRSPAFSGHAKKGGNSFSSAAPSRRKGIDVLLDAYMPAPSAAPTRCAWSLKDSGRAPRFYKRTNRRGTDHGIPGGP